MKEKNTYLDFELEDGEKIKLTLSFYRLYQLKSKKKDVYERCNKALVKDINEVLELITILYAAYLCANIDNIESCYSEVEFMQKVEFNFNALRPVVSTLVGNKKK